MAGSDRGEEAEGAFRARPRLSEFKDSLAAVRLGRSFSVGILVHCVMMGQGFHPASQYITQRPRRPEVGPGDEAAMVAIAQPVATARGADKSAETFE